MILPFFRRPTDFRLVALKALLVSLLGCGGYASAAETAAGLMQAAHEGRAVWNSFPGFSAQIRASSDDRQATGKLTVAANGDISLSYTSGQAPDWVERTLKSVVNHRLAQDQAVSNVTFADENENHPLGRLVKSQDASDHNQWRVKGDVMTEVHRAAGKTRFIISVADVVRTKEGKHLPRSFAVTTWDASSGALVSARQVGNEWTRVGSFDLPARLLAVNCKSDGSRQVEELVLSNHELLSTASAAKLEIRELAPLKAPVTSFGAAIASGHLYVYGGHLGTTHKYSADQQSNQFLRLNLARPESWEVVGEIPRRTGLAMVAHRGKIYRIGGWEARNAAGEKQDLHSTRDFAAFDTKTGEWKNLPALPEARSSHDAVVANGKVYVVGGWNMDGSSDGTWHETALTFDLGDEGSQWKEIARPPFTRRALALAEMGGKVYALGGMDDSNDSTTAVNVYDPQANAWSEAAPLPGKGIDGFAASAFGTPAGLYATTGPGLLYCLAPGGKDWSEIGKLSRPRISHRLLADDSGALVIVGGTSRGQGKVSQVELISVSK